MPRITRVPKGLSMLCVAVGWTFGAGEAWAAAAPGDAGKAKASGRNSTTRERGEGEGEQSPSGKKRRRAGTPAGPVVKELTVSIEGPPAYVTVTSNVERVRLRARGYFHWTEDPAKLAEEFFARVRRVMGTGQKTKPQQVRRLGRILAITPKNADFQDFYHNTLVRDTGSFRKKYNLNIQLLDTLTWKLYGEAKAIVNDAKGGVDHFWVKHTNEWGRYRQRKVRYKICKGRPLSYWKQRYGADSYGFKDVLRVLNAGEPKYPSLQESVVEVAFVQLEVNDLRTFSTPPGYTKRDLQLLMRSMVKAANIFLKAVEKEREATKSLIEARRKKTHPKADSGASSGNKKTPHRLSPHMRLHPLERK